eukprot:jgi/Bigna1/146053/aug1.108_g20761
MCISMRAFNAVSSIIDKLGEYSSNMNSWDDQQMAIFFSILVSLDKTGRERIFRRSDNPWGYSSSRCVEKKEKKKKKEKEEMKGCWDNNLYGMMEKE